MTGKLPLAALGTEVAETQIEEVFLVEATVSM